MQEIVLKSGELELTTRQNVIMYTTELGSSVAMAVYDRKSRMAGMAHIVLPDSSISNENDIIEEFGKFADTAVPAVLERLLSLGSKKEDLIIKIAGGANMYGIDENSYPFNIGQRNIMATQQAVGKLNLEIIDSDTGGNKGRALKLNVMQGMFYIKTANQSEVEF